ASRRSSRPARSAPLPTARGCPRGAGGMARRAFSRPSKLGIFLAINHNLTWLPFFRLANKRRATVPYAACDWCAKSFAVDREIDDPRDEQHPRCPFCGQPLRPSTLEEATPYRGRLDQCATRL